VKTGSTAAQTDRESTDRAAVTIILSKARERTAKEVDGDDHIEVFEKLDPHQIDLSID